MSDATARRVLVYTALFAGGSILAAPATGMSASIVAGAAAMASVFGNTLASDIHTAVTAESIDPVSSQHLRQLVGEALAALIECYRKEQVSIGLSNRLVSIFRHRGTDFSALAKAAKRHWVDLNISGRNVTLSEDKFHEAFLVQSNAAPYVSANEWNECLSEIAALARTRFGDPVQLTEEQRHAMAEYIATHFMTAVREIVKADLDPSVGTGGRVFVALHLDLTRTMADSLRNIDANSGEVLAQLVALKSHLDTRLRSVIDSLSSAQSAAVSDLITALEGAHCETRGLLAEMKAEQSQQNREVLVQLKAIAAQLVMRSDAEKMTGEPLDNLLAAIKRFANDGNVLGEAVMQLSGEGRFADAVEKAFDLAQNEAVAAVRLGEVATDARARAAKRWLDAGDVALASDVQKAAEAYQRCTELDPLHPYGWSRLGEVCWWIGRLDRSLQAYTKLWCMMPEGIKTLLSAVDPPETQRTRFLADHPDVSRDTYVWVVRGIIIAGLNIIEILQREPSLITQWIVKLVPLDQAGEARVPTEVEAVGIVELFRERIYSLGNTIESGAAQAEHLRILEALSRVASRCGELELSEEYLHRAREISVAQQDFVAEAVYLCNLGAVAGRRGRMNTAREYIAQALSICHGDQKQSRLVVSTRLFTPEELESRRLQHQKHLATGTSESDIADDEIEVSNLLSGDFERDTEDAMRRALKLKEVEGNAHGNLAHIATEEGNTELARREFEASLTIHSRIGFREGMAITRKALYRLDHRGETG